MTYKGTLVHLLLLGYSLCWVSGQDVVVNVVGIVQSSNIRSLEETEDTSSALVMLQNVTSATDFISLLVKDGRPVTYDQIFSNYSSDDGLLHISAGGRMAHPDDCSPRDTTVRLTFESSNPNLVYFPRCTKIERCGGCCASLNLECVPSYTERVSYKVIKAEVPYPGSSHLEWKGEYSTVILERHVTCRVQCILTADKCGPKKDFMERQCECKCREYQRCMPPKVWDPETCECKCAEVLSCCEDIEDGCGLVFSKGTCECGIDTEFISGRSNYTQAEIDAYYAWRNSSQNDTAALSLSSSPSPPPPTTSTTATTTITTTNTAPPTTTAATTTTTAAEATTTIHILRPDAEFCPTTHCPFAFVKTRLPNGHCTCRARVFHSFSRSRNTSVP